VQIIGICGACPRFGVACPGFGVASAKQPHDPHGPGHAKPRTADEGLGFAMPGELRCGSAAAKHGSAKTCHGMQFSIEFSFDFRFEFCFEFCFPEGEIETELETELALLACPKDQYA